MKKVLKVSVVLVLALTISASAFMSVDVTRKVGFYKGDGGEFTLTSSGDPIPGYAGSWQSFCLEISEPVYPGNNYYFDISSSAIRGGLSGAVNGSDPISAQTAYLYTQFLDEKLSDYDYEPGYFDRRLSAGELQEAIWYLEGETNFVNGQAAIWVNEAANSGWTTTGDIFVVNLFKFERDQRVERQSMLIRVPSVVPAPGAIVLASIGMLFVNKLRNRRR